MINSIGSSTTLSPVTKEVETVPATTSLERMARYTIRPALTGPAPAARLHARSASRGKTCAGSDTVAPTRGAPSRAEFIEIA